MENAVRYIELKNSFVLSLLKHYKTVENSDGRRFDRIITDEQVRYFIDRSTWEIFGAKSALQYNPRRWYGTLETVEEFDWFTAFPKTGTKSETDWLSREAEIQKNYKPRGRPKKVVTP